MRDTSRWFNLDDHLTFHHPLIHSSLGKKNKVEWSFLPTNLDTRDFPHLSQPACEQQDNHHHHDQSQAATGVVPPGPAVGPNTQCTEQEQDQYDQQDCVHITSCN